MTGKILANPAKLVTAMRYRDVAAATEWLTATFGFEKQSVVGADDGTIAVAHLSVGGAMIMLLPAQGTELDQLMKQPDEIGGAETQNCYLVVEDADLHYAKAKAAGAEFVLDLTQYANGSRGFSCRDPEGHIWSFGTYDPWGGESLVKDRLSVGELRRPGKRRRALTMAAVAAIAVVMGVAGWVLATVQHTTPNADEAQLRREAAPAASNESAELVRERSERAASRRAAQEARDALAREKSARETAERTARQMETQLTEARRAREADLKATQGARETAALAIRQAETRLSEERRARETAERTLKETQGARETAERTAAQMGRQLAETRSAKEAAEQGLKEAQGARETAALTIRRAETQLSEARRAKETAEKALEETQGARGTAERAAQQMEARLAEERRAREAAEQALKAAQGARETAERTAQQMETHLAEARRAKEATEQALEVAQGARATAERTARQLETRLAEARRARDAAERTSGEAQPQSGQVQDAEKAVAESPRQDAPMSELFSLQDMKRVAALADEKQLPLPPIRIRKPAADVPQSMRRFVGIWVSDAGSGQTSRQYMLVVTNVFPTGHAVGFHVVGPPQHVDALPGRADFFAFVGRLSGSELLIKKADLRIVGELNARNELNIVEAWEKGPPQGRLVLQPVWTLTDAERTAKP